MNHKKLDVWQKSMDFVEDVYKLIQNFPEYEKYGLTQQLRKAMVSIPSNISEGSARSSNKEIIHFLYISLGSLSEVETQLIIAKRLNYISEIKNFKNDIKNLKKMICGLIKYLKKNSTS